MNQTLLESDVLSKPEETKRRSQSYSLDPATIAILEKGSSRWGLSKSKLMDRAITWYLQAVEKDPSLLAAPDGAE